MKLHVLGGGTVVAPSGCMRRWERHWWETHTEKLPAVRDEPTVWVDPSLVDESPKRRYGRLPSPSVIGAYCTLDGSDD